MAEAIGLGASVLGFITIAAQLSQAILIVWNAIEDTPKDIQRVAARLKELQFILNRVRDEDLTAPDDARDKVVAFWLEQSNQLENDFTEYKILAEKLVSLLRKETGSVSSVRTKFHWFFKRDQVYALDQKVKTHIETFRTLLVFLTFDTVRTTSFDIQEMKHMNARSAQKIESLNPITRNDLANEISVWKSEFTRSLQQAIPFEARYAKKITTTTTMDSTITTSSNTWWTYRLPIGTLRVMRGSRKLNWDKIWTSGPSHDGSTAEETTSGIIFDFTPASWLMDKVVVGAFMLHYKKYSEIPAFTQMISTANMLPRRHAALRAARAGDVQKLQKLFSDGLARPSDRDHQGNTLLHLAASGHHYDASAFLISEGADCNAVDIYGRTALHEVFGNSPEGKDETQNLARLYKSSGCDSTAVARRGQSAFSEGLLEQLWLVIRTPDGATREKEFQRIFNVLPDFEEIDDFDPLPLLMALCTAYVGPEASQMVVEGAIKRWLKSHGKGFFDLDNRESYRKVLLQALKHKAESLTPDQVDALLRYACDGESTSVAEVIGVLVRPGVAVGERKGGEEGLGHSALILTAENGNLEAVEILLAAGADPTSEENGEAFQFAMMDGHYQVGRRLLDAGCCTPYNFRFVVERGLVEFASIFLERGIDVNLRFPLTKLQLSNPRFKGKNETPIFRAAYAGRLEMVQFLVKNGADVLAQDSKGATASSIASKNGKLSVAEFLRQEEERAKLRQECSETDTSVKIIKSIPAEFTTTSALITLTPAVLTPKVETSKTPTSESLVLATLNTTKDIVHQSEPSYGSSPEDSDTDDSCFPVHKEAQAEDLDTHFQLAIDSWSSLKTLTKEDILLITGGVLVAIWGFVYLFLIQVLAFLWKNRKHVTMGKIKILFWGLCIFASFTFLIGYLLGKK